jgi:catechol 2,3-dioxygenase-like lactoylglutathione lyase family enzyme
MGYMMTRRATKMLIRNVALVSVPVQDQERSIAFFRDKLGFEVRRDATLGPSGGRWVEVAPAGSVTTLTLTTWFERLRPGTLQGLVFATEELENAHASLLKSDVAVSDLKSAPWGRYFTFDDPDGNGFVLVQSKSQ